MRQHVSARGYAMILVLMVLALLSVGIGTLMVFQESSAKITGSLMERRRVFYACDGISRAATVLAQQYVLTANPTTGGLIDSICANGGGGCCATTTNTVTGSPFGGACEPANAASQFTRLTADPAGPGASALPLIVPNGFKIMELKLQSIAAACTVDAQCPGGTCVSGRCRTVSPLPNGPFSGMNARQDTVSVDILAAHTATTGFRCTTKQTLTLGKIAMFQFFLFSDSAITDWHPGPAMRASGRLHANGDLHINGNLKLQRVTASGDLRVFGSPGLPCTGGTCTSTARIARVDNPDFTGNTDFAIFARTNASWRDDALAAFGGNALDRAHGVPRLQLPIVGQPTVQRGYDGLNNIIPNTNASSGIALPNARLLVDPVRAGDPPDIVAQKFSSKADIRIINGVWYLNTPNSVWPGMPIWSDHGTYLTSLTADLVATRRAGQDELRLDRGWGSTYTPRRYSYYAMKAGTNQLIFDDAAASLVRAVISYGSLFRETSRGEHAPTWRPGVRTLHADTRDSWCEAFPSAVANYDITHTMLDALALDTATSPCPTNSTFTTPSTGFGRAAGLLAATRSGFRDGFAELQLCGGTDGSNDSPACERREANVMPMNVDIGALQQALADTTTGELGSYFCVAGGSCAMGRPFNGILYITNPYPGSESGYGANGGSGVPASMPAPIIDNATVIPGVSVAPLIDNVTLSTIENDTTPAAVGNWTTAGPMPLLRNNPNQPATNRSQRRDDEVLALPYPLCSNNTLPAAPNGMPGTQLSTRGYVFRRPQCGVGAAQPTTWLTGVRVINARVVNTRSASATPPAAIIDGAANIKPYTQADADAQLPDFPIGAPVTFAAGAAIVSPVGMLPNGLSMITNDPLYVVGDVNITSNAFDTTLLQPWVPVLFGGDTIHPFSNAWDDRKSRWAVSMGSNQLKSGRIARLTTPTNTVGTRATDGGVPREAQVTRWYMQVLSGWGQPVAGQAPTGIHNFPFFNENWADEDGPCGGIGDFPDGECPAIIYGSLVIGHNRVYTRWPFVDNANVTRSPPRRDWGFDTHLNDLTKQPPGAPIFDVSAIRQWSRN